MSPFPIDSHPPLPAFACWTPPACWPGRSAANCSPTSAPTSSSSNAPAPATTRAAGDRPFSGLHLCAYFLSCNRDKRSLTLDIAQAGRERDLPRTARASRTC